MRRKFLVFISLGLGTLLLLSGVFANQIPALGAALILHPLHKPIMAKPPAGCEKIIYAGSGVKLQGWHGRAIGKRRGTLIYLHGVADNRAGGAGIMERYRKRGFDVVAYDSRANGESEGDACTYGFYEKEDLRHVLDTVEKGPVILLGSSLGAAVAIQSAAIDKRITAVVAAEIFSDLRTVVTERAPFFFSHEALKQAIKLAENEAHFHMDDVSPVAAATKITIPVLLIHGAVDTDTPPDHSRRIHKALAGTKRLILVPNAKHNESMHGTIWDDIDQWIDGVLAPAHDHP